MTTQAKRQMSKTVAAPAIEISAPVHFDYTDYAVLAHKAHEARIQDVPEYTMAAYRSGFTKTRTDWPVVL